MNPLDLVGKRIQYRKGGTRNGWTGTISMVRLDRTMPGDHEIQVEYDNGIIQVYCLEAVECFKRKSTDFPDSNGYLHIIEAVRPVPKTQVDSYIVKCLETNGEVVCKKMLDAEACAENLASESVHGYTYIVYLAIYKFKKAENPVTRTEL